MAAVPNIGLQRTRTRVRAAEAGALAAAKLWWVAALIAGFSAPCWAKDVTSSMGFSVEIPDAWMVLSAPEVKANPDLFEAAFSKIGPVDKSALDAVRTQIESGLMEFYFSDKTFPDGRPGINVIKMIEAVPTTPAGVKATCDAFPASFEKAFKRPITMNICVAKSVVSHPAVYMEYTGLKPGWFTVSYVIARSSSVEVTITGTFPLSTHSESLKEFERVVNSLRFPDGG